MLRVGEGYDLHRLVEGRPLRLACVDVPFSRGSLGHSDGDAAAHAVCDAILGALALGDMGSYFPSSDSRWKDTNSVTFLHEAARLLRERGGGIVNLDVTIVVEEPRLSSHISEMRKALADGLDCVVEAVSVKAKSADGVGPIGRGEAVEARAVVLVDLGTG